MARAVVLLACSGARSPECCRVLAFRPLCPPVGARRCASARRVCSRRTAPRAARLSACRSAPRCDCLARDGPDAADGRGVACRRRACSALGSTLAALHPASACDPLPSSSPNALPPGLPRNRHSCPQVPAECRPYFPPWRAPNSGGPNTLLVRCGRERSGVLSCGSRFADGGRHGAWRQWRPVQADAPRGLIYCFQHIYLMHYQRCTPCRIATGAAVLGAAAAAVMLLARGMRGRRRVPLGGQPDEGYDPLQRWLSSPTIKTRS